MADPKPNAPSEAPSDPQNSFPPFRLLVKTLFWLGSAFIAVVVLRGILTNLDRMPIEGMPTSSELNPAALKACAVDLEALGKRLQTKVSGRFAEGEVERHAVPWSKIEQRFEAERLRIIAYCRLDRPHEGEAHEALRKAVVDFETLLRAYRRIDLRYEESVVEPMKALHQHLEPALQGAP